MKKISKSAEMLWLMGVIFVAFGVALCSKANLGVSMIAAPAFIVYQALSNSVSFLSVGMTEYLIQALLLIITCLVVRKFNWRYLLGFLVAVLYGYVLDLFLWILSFLNFDAVYVRWITLLVGDLFIAFGVACYFRTYMPLQIYELFVSEMSKKYDKNVNKVKWIFDISLLIISLILAITLFGDLSKFDWSTILTSSFHSIGLGTIITTLINSPLILLAGKFIDKFFENQPRFIKFSEIIRIK